MPLIAEKFDQSKVDTIKRFLQREADKGRARDYEIIVDGFRIVSRTSNVEEFEDYEDHIMVQTKNISFLVYDGPTTPRNTKYTFFFQEVEIPKRNNELGNLPNAETIATQKIEEFKRETEVTALREKVTTLEKELEEAEEYHDILQARIDEYESKKYLLSGVNLGELAGIALESVFKKNAHKIPVIGEQLAGILKEPEQPKQITEPEGEASFTKAAGDGPQLTEVQRRHLHNLMLMEQAFSTNQLNLVVEIIKKLMEQPSNLTPVAELLNVPKQ